MRPTIEIHDSVELGMGIDRAWELVTDPEVVVSCVPGAEVLSTDPDGTIRGALTVSLGPSATRFEGRVTPSFDPEQRSGRLQGQGGDGRGRTKAAIDTSFTLREVEGDPSKTTMAIDSSIAVSGALAGFAMTGGQPVARRLLQDFAANLADLHAADAGEPGARPSVAPQRLSGFGLVFRALWDALVRVLGRLGGQRDRQGELP